MSKLFTTAVGTSVLAVVLVSGATTTAAASVGAGTDSVRITADNRDM